MTAISIPKLQLIGIHGHAGTGKDTIARYLSEFYANVYTEHFADPLKDACSHAFGIPREHFDIQEYKLIANEFWGTSPRKIAQYFGTELFRQTIAGLLPTISNDFWVKRLAGKLSGELILDGEGIYEDGETVLIPDVRFQNEVDFILANRGVIITVKRSGYEGNVGIQNHPSEAGNLEIPSGSSYLILNDGTIPELFGNVDAILPSLHSVHNITFTRV